MFYDGLIQFNILKFELCFFSAYQATRNHLVSPVLSETISLLSRNETKKSTRVKTCILTRVFPLWPFLLALPSVFRREEFFHQGIRQPDYYLQAGSSEAKCFELLDTQDGGRRKMIKIQSLSQVCSVPVFNFPSKTSGTLFNNLQNCLPDADKSVACSNLKKLKQP